MNEESSRRFYSMKVFTMTSRSTVTSQSAEHWPGVAPGRSLEC